MNFPVGHDDIESRVVDADVGPTAGAGVLALLGVAFLGARRRAPR